MSDKYEPINNINKTLEKESEIEQIEEVETVVIPIVKVQPHDALTGIDIICPCAKFKIVLVSIERIKIMNSGELRFYWLILKFDAISLREINYKSDF